ncbi:MAG: ABC transporter permease [Treponema sp.]|jgi:spermidine/putrescine transport system permease protein|nr:ABC transporter permease [Treponema sp.]
MRGAGPKFGLPGSGGPKFGPAKIYISAVLALMYVPILLVIVYSFNRSRQSSQWGGFSLYWYGELFRDRALFEALLNSLILGVLSSFCAAVIGVLAASGMARAKLPGAKGVEALAVLPIITPEVVMGMVSLAFFAFLSIPFGMLTLLLAHTSMCIPYVFLLVKARLAGIDKSLLEAARDLGAGEWRAFRDITLPLVMPAVVSGLLISFAMSFDDVIVSVFVTGVNTNTLPVRIYTSLKVGVTPKINAMCTLLFALTALLSLCSAIISGYGGRSKNAEKKIEGEI